MADLSLADALTEPPPEIEEEIKRDFIATLEAEAFDDVVGETVGKTDYIPLLDVDEKTGNSESKKKPCSDTSQVEEGLSKDKWEEERWLFRDIEEERKRTFLFGLVEIWCSTPSSKPTVLANGDHGIEGNTTGFATYVVILDYQSELPFIQNLRTKEGNLGSPTEFLEEKMAYQGYQNNQNWPEDTNFCFEPEQVVNPIQTDPFKMHHDDGLEDLLFLPSGTTSTSSFTEQNDPLKDSYEPADIEMTSAEERTPTKALEVIMGLKASDMAPSRESEIVPAKDVAPASETEVALTKDMEPPTKSDTALVKDMGMEEALVKDVVLPTETEVAPAKDVTLFKETERTPLVKMDLAPADNVAPPTDREMTPAKDVASLSEIGVALAKDVVSSTEIASAKEVALSSETEVALVKDVTPTPETEVTPVKDMTPPPEIKMALGKDVAPPETEVAPVKDMVSPPETEMALGKNVALPSETEKALGKDVVSPLETEMAPGKNVALSPETEMALGKDVVSPPETEVTLAEDVALPPGTEVTLANNVAPTKDVAASSEAEVAPVPVKDMEIARAQEETSEDSQLESLQVEGQSVAPTLMISPEPVTAMGQKYSLPVDEDSMFEKLEQKKLLSSPPSELSSETSGTPPTQAKQACRPSDRRSTRPRPARVPPELLGGSSPRKTLDPGLGLCPLSELGWVSGSSSCSEPGNQRKPIHGGFLEPQRDFGREAWDIYESTPMMMKKKKKKPKQKRYSQPRDGGPWDDDNAGVPKGHPFATDPQKSGVLPSQPTMVGTEHGLVSRENLKKECDIDSRTAKLAAENLSSESISTPSCPLQELLKTAGNSQPRLSVAAEVKDNPLESSLKEVNDENEMTKQHNDKQKEFSEGGEQVKELKKEAIPKQRHENSIFASEQLQDKVLVQGPGLGNEPLKRMADSQKDSGAVLVPEEPAPKAERMTAGDKSEELGPDFPKQPGTLADLTEGVVVGEPKEMTDLRVAGPLQPLTLWGHGSDVVQTSVARTERGAMATGDHRIEGMSYVDENRNITFTCPRTPAGLMNKSVPLEAQESAACGKLPTPPQVVKESDSLPDTLAESSQETAPAQISTVVVVDNCSKDGATEEERPKAPSAVTPSTSTGGVAPTSTAAEETVNSHGGNCLKNKRELADPMADAAGVDGGHVRGESESVVPSAASQHSAEKITEPAEGLLPPGVPVGDQSLAGEVRVPQARADRSNFPTCPVNKRKESEEGSAAVPIPNLLGDKTQKPPFREDQNARERVSKGPDSLIMEVDGPPKSEKAKLEEISLASEITELESVSLAPPELQSDVFSGRVEATPSRVVDKLVVTASKSPQVPEPKDKILEAPEKMTEKSEPKAPGEGKKEDKGRMAEPMKGYMRPTKSRGLTPLLPKSTVQERERSKQLKSSACMMQLLTPEMKKHWLAIA
ncbi:Microtubule-associated protein 4 [Camelus dromedarius]|uniref:Microtubule-associated protein 4 n=1 Tax=Camelus dromedarius TaxID=9838 RepID=A0A5N4D0H6_CAMDR|nr:Microtubule-associated protein 4 [Camelus dromedarius]